MRFQDLFHSPPGVLFAFPSRYWFTIGRLRVFSLGGWSPHLQTGFHVSRPTCLTPSLTQSISSTGLSPCCGRPFQNRSTIDCAISSRLLRFRSPLLSESRLISVPRATEMFQFTRFASAHLCIQCGIRHRCRGFPHSDICGSKLVCQLPAAFRRLPRPSSPVIAKASTICTYSLDPIT